MSGRGAVFALAVALAAALAGGCMVAPVGSAPEGSYDRAYGQTSGSAGRSDSAARPAPAPVPATAAAGLDEPDGASPGPGLVPIPAPVLLDPQPTRLVLSTGDQVLGAYQLVVEWDPTVAVIQGVDGGSAVPFCGSPILDPHSFATGRMRLIGLQVGAHGASGRLHVATIRWSAVGPGDAGLDLLLETAVDPEARILPAGVEAEPAEVTVGLQRR